MITIDINKYSKIIKRQMNTVLANYGYFFESNEVSSGATNTSGYLSYNVHSNFCNKTLGLKIQIYLSIYFKTKKPTFFISTDISEDKTKDAKSMYLDLYAEKNNLPLYNAKINKVKNDVDIESALINYLVELDRGCATYLNDFVEGRKLESHNWQMLYE